MCLPGAARARRLTPGRGGSGLRLVPCAAAPACPIVGTPLLAMLLLVCPKGGAGRSRGRRTRGGTAVRRLGPRPRGPVFKRADPGADARQLLADVVVEALDLRVDVRQLL
eukprot:4390943-Alexandrium_andersonii.AAC.1